MEPCRGCVNISCVYSIFFPPGEKSSDEITSLIQGYIKEIEELRTKLVESEAVCEQIRRNAARTPSRSSMSPMTNRPMTAMTTTSQDFDLISSPQGNVSSLIEEAKKDLKRLKKKAVKRQDVISEETENTER